MAARREGKHVLVYGRRPRGGAKASRSGPVPRKCRRRSWGQAPGQQARTSTQRRFRSYVEGRKVYGPFRAAGGASC